VCHSTPTQKPFCLHVFRQSHSSFIFLTISFIWASLACHFWLTSSIFDSDHGAWLDFWISVQELFSVPNAAFTLNGFDDQERNIMLVKTVFQVLKLESYDCSFKQAFYPTHKLYIAWPWQHENIFVQAFLSVPGCQTCMCKRGILPPPQHFATFQAAPPPRGTAGFKKLRKSDCLILFEIIVLPL